MLARGGPCAGVLLHLFLMRRDLSFVQFSSICLFSSGCCLIFSLATVFSTLDMVFLGVCLCLSYLRFFELLGSMGLCFLPNLGRFWPLFLCMVFLPYYLATPSGLLITPFGVVLWNTKTVHFFPQIYFSSFFNLDNFY